MHDMQDVLHLGSVLFSSISLSLMLQVSDRINDIIYLFSYFILYIAPDCYMYIEKLACFNLYF